MNRRNNRKIRLIALGVLACSAVLLTGAGHFSDNLQSRRANREQQRSARVRALRTVLEGTIPERERDPLQLRDLTEKEPELLLSILCSELKTLPQ